MNIKVTDFKKMINAIDDDKEISFQSLGDLTALFNIIEAVIESKDSEYKRKVEKFFRENESRLDVHLKDDITKELGVNFDGTQS